MPCSCDSKSQTEQPREEQKFKRVLERIDKYVQDYMVNFEKGNVCVYYIDCPDCKFYPAEEYLPGEIPGHLKSHFEKGVYPGSLLLSALEKYPVEPHHFDTALYMLEWKDVRVTKRDIELAVPVLRKQLRRYLKYLCGFSA